MAQTSRIAGNNFYATFAGTVISGDYTSMDFDESVTVVKLPAGGDTFTYKVSTGRKDGKGTFKSLYNATGAGTAVWAQLAPGASGTLILAPAGTATGNQKFTVSTCIVQSRSFTEPFEGAVEYTVNFEFGSAIAEAAY